MATHILLSMTNTYSVKIVKSGIVADFTNMFDYARFVVEQTGNAWRLGDDVRYLSGGAMECRGRDGEPVAVVTQGEANCY